MRHVVLAAGLISAVAASAAQAAIRPGVYSSVCYVPEADDYGGYELQLRTDGPAPTVVFKMCEGGCYEQRASDVVLSGDTLSFKAAQDLVDENGKKSTEVSVYSVRRSGRNLVVETPPEEDLRLKTLRFQPGERPERPGDNPVAKGMKGWPAPTKQCG
jgi:hypothetical protein